LIWYNEPGAVTPGQQTQMICNIPTLIHYTTQRLLLGQAIGAVLGALLFLVIAGFAGASEEPAPAACAALGRERLHRRSETHHFSGHAGSRQDAIVPGSQRRLLVADRVAEVGSERDGHEVADVGDAELAAQVIASSQVALEVVVVARDAGVCAGDSV